MLFFPVSSVRNLCSPMNCRTAGFPSLHCFPEFAQLIPSPSCYMSQVRDNSLFILDDWKSGRLKNKNSNGHSKTFSLCCPMMKMYAVEKGVSSPGAAICDASSHKSWTSRTRLYSPSVRFWTVGQLCRWPNLINVFIVTWVRHPASQIGKFNIFQKLLLLEYQQISSSQ